MRFSAIGTIVALASVAQAHFQLQYPTPRGVFVQDNEPKFCDGYTNAVNNRTVFPLTGGVVQLNSEHPKWTVGVLVSTKSNPTSFSDFNDANGNNQLVTQFFQATGEGLAYFSVDLSKSNVTGLNDGANVTFEVTFNGGDGTLYQCADLTLSSSATVPSNATSSGTNITSNEVSASSSASSSASASGSSSSSTKSGATVAYAARAPVVLAGLLVIAGVGLVL